MVREERKGRKSRVDREREAEADVQNQQISRQEKKKYISRSSSSIISGSNSKQGKESKNKRESKVK